MVPPETWADAEVEIVDECDKNHGKAATNDAVGSRTASTTGNSAGDAATEKDATMRRLGELHRLFNSRKGSLNATYKKITDANDKAYDPNQKSFQALDALAAENVAFEATLANVTSEYEARDVLHAAALEVAEELQRTQKDRGRPKDDLDCSCDDLAAANQRIFRLLGSTRGYGR